MRTDGRLACWGRNDFGQVSGPNASTDTFSEVRTGYAHTCGLRTNGRLACWGYDFAGQVSGPNASTDVFGPDVHPAETANLDMPDAINKKSKGQYITAYIEFPDSAFSPADVDGSTVTLQAIDPVTSIKLHVAIGSPTEVGDGNGNGIVDLMVKFDRATVQSWFSSDATATFRIEGRFQDGTAFQGDTSVPIIDAGTAYQRGLRCQREGVV